MHDPMTVAFEIKYPWLAQRGRRDIPFYRTYRESFITIWHVDPEKDGTDDSCGWFQRARHSDKAVIERIIKRFDSDWDRTYTGESGHVYASGLFHPGGAPVLSAIGVTLNLFFLAALEIFEDREKAERFMSKHLFQIMMFAENPTDSLYTSIWQVFGVDGNREERIAQFARVVYPWILREIRPWWRHPRWHFWHWRVDVQPWKKFRRWALTRCCRCGRGFKWGESPTTNSWDTPAPKFLRGEIGLYHGNCNGDSCEAKDAQPAGTP